VRNPGTFTRKSVRYTRPTSDLLQILKKSKKKLSTLELIFRGNEICYRISSLGNISRSDYLTVYHGMVASLKV